MTFRSAPESLAIKIAKFSGIGVINTMIHTFVVVLSIEQFGAHPTLANALAFVIANTFSYWANRRWSFKATASMGQYGRFLVVSLAGLLATVLISGFSAWAGFHYLFGLSMVFVTLPALTFLLHWQWTFKR